MKSNHKSKLMMCIITAIIAIVEFIVIQIAIYLGMAPDGVQAALGMLLASITYIVLSSLLVYIKKFRYAMWLAIYAFIFLCIFVWYSRSITDVFTFVILLFGLLYSMLMLNEKIKEQEAQN